MSSSKERVGGVEPETVDEFLEDGQVVLWRVREKGASEDEWSAWTDFDFESSHEFYDRSMVEVEEVKFVPLSALRLVEEELRQAREERDGARLAGQEVVAALAERTAQRNKAEADRDRLAGALREIADQDWVENVLDPQWAARIAEAALSPVQGEHHAQPEGESQMGDNNLYYNNLIGERDAMKWVDGFLTVVPDADRDLMLTWFACAIESGRMTVQGEHENPSLEFDGAVKDALANRNPSATYQGEHEQDGGGRSVCGGCEAMDRTASGGQGVRNDDSEATR